MLGDKHAVAHPVTYRRVHHRFILLLPPLVFFSVYQERLLSFEAVFRLNRYFTVITGIVITAYLGYIDFFYSA